MDHDQSLGDPEELAALDAVGALPPEEAARFEAHLLAGCEACRAERRVFERVTAALAAAADPATPAPGTREALLRRLGMGPEPSASTSPLRQHFQEASPGQELVIRRSDESPWEPTEIPGVQVRTLFVDRGHNQFTALVRMAPGTSYPPHLHSGPEECFVLEGDLHVGAEVMRAGDYQRAPAGSRHGVQHTEQGCLLLVTASLTDVFV
jgi:anti-sigma factor ChrR (cupin superfamily)